MIGDRIREFGDNNYPSISSFAHALGMKPQSLYPYLNSKKEPGTPILLKLHKLGADILYIVTGNKNKESQKADYIDLTKEVDRLNTDVIKLKAQNDLLRELLREGEHSQYKQNKPQYRAVSENLPIYEK